MCFSLCYSLGGFKIFCLFAMFALVNIKYKRKPAENEINVYSAGFAVTIPFHYAWVHALVDLQPSFDDCGGSLPE